MTKANDFVLEQLLDTLFEIWEDLPEDLSGFWKGWIRDGRREAVEKGYDH